MPSPAVTGTTATTPSIIPIASLPTIASIAVDGGTSPSSGTVSTGTLSTTLAPKVNDHAARLDIGAMALNGLYVVMSGLALSWTSGLTVNIAAGQAFIEGIREITATTKVVGDNATTRLWMDVTGAITSGTGAYAPTLSVYLGSVTTLAGVVTAIDIAGVLRMNGGIAVRTVADTGKPVDTPTTSAVFITYNSVGESWLWNGTNYCFIEDRAGTVALVDGASIALNATLGNIFNVTLGGNRALAAASGLRDRQKFTIYVKQDATGSRTLTLNAAYKVPSTITVSQSTAAAAIDRYDFEYTAFGGCCLIGYQKGY